MSGTSGLNTGDFTSVNVAYGIGVGVNGNEGLDGQILISGGENKPNRWEHATGIAQSKLTASTNISMTGTSGAVSFYDGSVPVSISSTDSDTTYQGSTTINIDATTNPDTINVIKVPQTLTITQGGTSVVYDGETAKSISLTDGDTTYDGGIGISIDTSGGLPHTINCANIPNSALANSTISGVALGGTLANLTIYNFGGGFNTSYNGTSPTSITLDGDTLYSATDPISKTTTGTDAGSFGLLKDETLTLLPNTSLQNELSVVKVPNTLTITQGATSVVYDGGTAKSITLTDGDTTYGAVAPITKTTPTTDSGNFGLAYDTTTLEVPTTGGNTGKLVVKQVPQNLTAGTGISFSSGTTYNGSTAITITATGGVSDTTKYAWRSNTISGLTSDPLYIQFPKSVSATGDFYKWYLNGDNPSSSPTGNFVEMRYTMLSGGRYYKITIDFDFYISPTYPDQHSQLYFKWFKTIGGTTTELDYQPTLISGWEASSGTIPSVFQMRHASQSYIYDHGSTLGSDTNISFFPECANLRIGGTTTTSRPIYIMTKNTNGSATSNIGNELTGTITDLGRSFTIGTE